MPATHTTDFTRRSLTSWLLSQMFLLAKMLSRYTSEEESRGEIRGDRETENSEERRGKE